MGLKQTMKWHVCIKHVLWKSVPLESSQISAECERPSSTNLYACHIENKCSFQYNLRMCSVTNKSVELLDLFSTFYHVQINQFHRLFGKSSDNVEKSADLI